MNSKDIRKLNVATHRDLGYFISGLIIVYCISGLALNHVDDWNPDFILQKDSLRTEIRVDHSNPNESVLIQLCKLTGNENYRVYDFPTEHQIKIYFQDATLHVNQLEGIAVYEKIIKRPLFYQTNVIHRNRVKGWKWISDIFAILLLLIAITGMFVLKGKHGITGRGKWLMAAGTLPPLIAIIIQEIT